MKIAIVHDWFTLRGGAERVLEQIFEIYPDADVFAVVDFMPEQDRGFLRGKPVTTTFVQRLPFARKHYRSYLALMPLAIEQLDLSGYDLVLSSTTAVAKGVITGPDQVHVSYVHSPIRYAWDLQAEYLRESGLERGVKGMIARTILHYMRIWDLRTVPGVDHMMANSRFIARRIRKTYGRDATVVYPPVDLDRFSLPAAGRREDFYLTVSRMVPYKRIPMIAQAFAAMPDKKLKIIGDGPEMDAVKAVAGPNTEILGKLSDADVIDHMQRTRAFIFAAQEDFGLVPVEAQACGAPVIAFGVGGACETVIATPGVEQTGVFFNAQDAEALRAAVTEFERVEADITAAACRANAERFSSARFRTEFAAVVDEAVARASAA